MESIRIKPFHVFQVYDQFFVLKTRSLFYECINKSEFSWLQKIKGILEMNPAPGELDLLKRLFFIAPPGSPINSAGYLEIDKMGWNSMIPAESKISGISLLVTTNCTMSCVYCYEQDEKQISGGCMTHDTAIKAIDWMFSQNA
jgi:sulfatase maturation enzyme AslB (radical SAM superfamily)